MPDFAWVNLISNSFWVAAAQVLLIVALGVFYLRGRAAHKLTEAKLDSILAALPQPAEPSPTAEIISFNAWGDLRDDAPRS